MNFFCRIFGHTWLDEMRAPDPRWNTTKDGVTLVPTHSGSEPRYVQVCRRCRDERELGMRLPAGAMRDREAPAQG